MRSWKETLGLAWLHPGYFIYGWVPFFKEEVTIIGIYLFMSMVIFKVLGLSAYFSYILFGGAISLVRRFLAGGICTSSKSLKGKLIIITGANVGIGRDTAKFLLIRGAELVLACRNMEQANQVADELRLEFGGKVKALKCDLSSFKSVRAFAKEFEQKYDRLDMLINNAGVMKPPRTITEDGNELQYQVNHYSHFLLSYLLLPMLRKSEDPRLINLSSIAHWEAKMNFDDMKYEKSYSLNASYGNSKLANILFTTEFNKRCSGTKLKAFAIHPGVVQSNLGRFLPSVFADIWSSYLQMISKTTAEGAHTTVYCATDAEVTKYGYYADCRPANSSNAARDPKLAEDFWVHSEKVCGIKFDIPK